MFPITANYITNEYIKDNKPVEISYKDSTAIIKKCKKLLALLKQGKTEFIYPNVMLIASTLLKEKID